MKYIIIILLMMFGVSCSKEKPMKDKEVYNGFASGLINGEEYRFSPRMTPSHGNDTTYNLLIDYLIGDKVLSKTISFSYVRSNLSNQVLNKFEYGNKADLQCDFSTRISDGDVAGNYYLLAEEDNFEDYLHLISFDKFTGNVTGEFQASFVVDTTHLFDASSPDTIIITNGYFETKIIN